MPDTQELIRTTCPRDCFDTCGITVIKRDGVIAHVRGDPHHPVSRGKLCPKCSIGYNREWRDPHARLTRPLRRVGPKGEGRFEPVSWDTALAAVAEHFREIAATTGPHAYEHWLREAPGRVVVIDPIRTPTAQAADLHLQPFPGSDAALAFALLHVLWRDGLIDEDFVHAHTVGWEELEPLPPGCTPAWGQATTGVAARRLAQAMGYTEPELYEPDADILATVLRQANLGVDFPALAPGGPHTL